MVNFSAKTYRIKTTVLMDEDKDPWEYDNVSYRKRSETKKIESH